MSGATPRPWRRDGKHIYKSGKNSANICSVSEPRADEFVGYTELKLGSPNFNEAMANADLIVRAVNSHDALVAALRDAEEFILQGNNRMDPRRGILETITAAIALATSGETRGIEVDAPGTVSP